jgi:hypothetical protein
VGKRDGRDRVIPLNDRRSAVVPLRMPDPQNAPMGRLDAFDIGPKKLTVQTEFFSKPTWRAETKVYLGGALKKVYTADLAATAEPDLQKSLNDFHQAKIDEIVSGLRQKKP